MGVLTPELQDLLDENPIGVLATLSQGGRPRQSVVYFTRDGERLLISTLGQRFKARDVERSPWASLSVMGHERPFPSATFSGSAEILTEDIGDATARVAQRAMGTDEPPEPMTDEALAEAGRVILAIDVERVTAATHLAAGAT